jgi:hypothetical protein
MQQLHMLVLMSHVCVLSLVLLLPQGFQQLKVLRSARNISCFVEFETVETAMQCHSTQQVRGLGLQ